MYVGPFRRLQTARQAASAYITLHLPVEFVLRNMCFLRQLRLRYIYTDGLKMGDRVASAAICSNMVRSTRLPNNAIIFRAELYAIKLTLAMYFVRRSRNSNFVIFSDSMSSLEALNGFELELDLVQKIIKDYIHISPTMGKRSSFVGSQVM